MLRRLLACLALVTSLVAGGVPAYAVGALGHGTQLVVADKDDTGAPTLSANCNDRGRQQQARGDKASPCKPGKTVTIVIPTVQLGADRAFE